MSEDQQDEKLVTTDAPLFTDVLTKAGLPIPELSDLLRRDPEADAAYKGERAAWNAERAKRGEPELPYHDTVLTTEDAQRVNDHVNIIAFLGIHGIPLPDTSAPLDREALQHFEGVVTEQEFNEAAAVVDKLRPGDILAIEHYGFDKQPPEPALLSADELSKQRAQLEAQKELLEINPWEYAQQLALLKGVRVVYADQDLFDAERLVAVSGVSAGAIFKSRLPEMRAFARQLHRQRDRAAHNVVKDLALSLATDATPRRTDKPTIGLLYGLKHEVGLNHEFNFSGLHLLIHRMETSSMQDRMDEHINRLGKLGLLDNIAPPAVATVSTQRQNAERRALSRVRPSGIAGSRFADRLGSYPRKKLE